MLRLTHFIVFNTFLHIISFKFSFVVASHEPVVKIHSLLIGNSDTLQPSDLSSLLSTLQELESLNPSRTTNDIINQNTVLVKNDGDEKDTVETQTGSETNSDGETPTVEQECSESAEPSKEPSKGLFNKDFKNEIAVSEPPYGWVYPPEAKEVHRIKTLHLFLPDAIGKVEVIQASRGKRDYLRNILGDTLSFYMPKKAYIQAESSKDNDDITEFADEKKNESPSKPTNNLRRSNKITSWVHSFSNPISRAYKAVEDWWNGDEPSTTTSTTNAQTPYYGTPYATPTPSVPASPYGSPVVQQPTTPDRAGYASPTNTIQPYQPLAQPPTPYPSNSPASPAGAMPTQSI